MEVEEQLDSEMKPCAVCFSQIPTQALKCKHCGEFQNEVKRKAMFGAQIANIVAIGTFVTAALVFGGNLVSDLWVRLFPKASIEFFSYDSGQLNIANTGDGAIFVDSISFKRAFPGGEQDFSTRDYKFFGIKKVVKEGEFLAHSFQANKPFMEEKNSQMFGQRFEEGTALYESMVEVILKNRDRDDAGKACVYMPFLSSEDYSYWNTNELLKRQGFEEGVFKIWYVSQIRYYSRAQRAWHIYPFMAVSTPTLSTDEKCADVKEVIDQFNEAKTEE